MRLGCLCIILAFLLEFTAVEIGPFSEKVGANDRIEVDCGCALSGGRK